MTTLREALEKSVQTAETAAEPSTETDTPVDPTLDSEAGTSGAPEGSEATTTADRGSEADPGATDTADAPVGGEQQPAPGTPASQQQQAEPEDPAPGSWTPAAREQWKSLPKEIRAEVKRREADVTRAFAQTAEARKLQKEFQDTIQPFMPFIAAENSTPMVAVKNMMQMAALFRVGTPQQKVQAAANIIKQFGVDLVMLDSVLAGQQPQDSQATYMQQMIAQEMAPVRQFMQNQQAQLQQRSAQLDQQVQTEIAQFAEKNEFYNDVREVMADLIDVAQRRGQTLSLTDAYSRAIMLHEPVRQVIEARKQRQQAQNSQRQANSARHASVSVTGSEEAMAAGAQATGTDLRSHIEAAILKTSSR